MHPGKEKQDDCQHILTTSRILSFCLSLNMVRILFHTGDTTPPLVTCPQNINSQFQCQQANDAITFPPAVASDNSGVQPNVRYSSGSIQFSQVGNSITGTFGLGVTTVTATATDNCGLTSSCQFTVSTNQGKVITIHFFSS